MKLAEEQKQQNKRERAKNKEFDKFQSKIISQKEQKEIQSLTITIEWRKSRTWGSNPYASCRIHYKDGTFRYEEKVYTASGYGYDKESTVIAEIFNDFLRYKLWNRSIEELKDSPYGISSGEWITSLENKIEYRRYDGGVGTNCYYDISKFIGGEFICVASGKTFDVYKYEEK